MGQFRQSELGERKMRTPHQGQGQPAQQESEHRVYKAPAIIYEGTISTRAGTPLPPGPGGDDGVDPADLFGG